MVNVGIDLHKTQFTVCARTSKGEMFGKFQTTEDGYQLFLKEAAKWQKAGEEIRVGVESTGNTRYFKNRMEDAGIGVTVINTLKFKVVNESVKKTDKYDASVIAEFLEKDMLPVSRLCSRESEQMRRLLNVRTTLVRAQVKIKNQIHALLSAEGLESIKGSLQSKKGRKQALDTLNQCTNGLVVQPLIETIDRLDENVNVMEKELRALTAGDRMVELLMTIPGCGEICAWTIRAYTDDIARFSSAKKYVSYAGLAPWVQNSNEIIRHGKITKRGPEQLRTAIVQVVMGLRRMKAKTCTWRLMQRYEMMKQIKGSGKSIIATARKMATIIWHMLNEDVVFNLGYAIDQKLAKKSESMRTANQETVNNLEITETHELTMDQPVLTKTVKKSIKKTGVARSKKIKIEKGVG